MGRLLTIVLIALGVLAACSATGAPASHGIPTRTVELGKYPSMMNHGTTQPVAIQPVPAVRPTSHAVVYRAPAPVPARIAPAPSRSAPTPLPANGTYVRLRGTVEVHRPTCRKVKRAHPDGVLKASASDGPACFYCLGKGQSRPPPKLAPHYPTPPPAPSPDPPPAPSPDPAPDPAPAPPRTSVGDLMPMIAPSAPVRYVHLAGSIEVHLITCPKARKARADGITDADPDSGPHCPYCLGDRVYEEGG